MQNLFVLRHADYNGNKVTESGIIELQNRADLINMIIGPDKLHIISSSAPRAEISVAGLTHRVKNSGEVEFTSLLWTGDDGPNYSFLYDNNAKEELLNKIHTAGKNSRNVLVLGHLEFVEWYPYHFLKEKFKVILRRPGEIKHGQGIHFDTDRRLYRWLMNGENGASRVVDLPSLEKFCRFCEIAPDYNQCNLEVRERAILYGRCQNAKLLGLPVKLTDDQIRLSGGETDSLYVEEKKYEKSEKGLSEIKRDLRICGVELVAN